MTNRDESLRALLEKILDWEDAHASFDSAVQGLAPALRGVAPEGLPHSPWQLIEHVRRCQLDILEFCRSPAYAEAAPKDYWPPAAAPPNDAAWDESVAGLRRDRDDLKRLARDTPDLFERIPHGSGQTYLRELLLVADHNAYHVGQLVSVRRLLDAWRPVQSV